MKKTLLVLSSLFLFDVSSFAQETIELEKIVVTPYRYAEEINNTAASITIIKESDILNSDAKNVLEVLRSVPGLVVRDWIGNATKASVDIRGFGEQGAMNVLVLIDGRRINEVDLSGVDWTQIPLNQIQRIEIIRGGAGSVLYGDNAVSGVINIITKNGEGKPKLEFQTHYGSYDANLQKFSLGGSQDKLSYWLSASREMTHGYRNNSYYNAGDFASKIDYEIFEDFLLRFSSGYHRSNYGLPGALSSSDITNFGNRYSKYGDDHAKDRDNYFVLGIDKKFGRFGELSLDTSFRRKEVFTNFIGANAGWNPFLKSRIDTLGILSKYKLDSTNFGKENKLIIGVDFYRYDYSANTFNSSNILQDFIDIDKISIGGYFQDEISILENLTLVAGYRYESAKYEFDYHDNSGWSPDVDTNTKPNKKAMNAGVVYKFSDASSVFFNTSRSFRFPVTDEYFTWGSLNLNLKPQNARNYEFGLRHSYKGRIKLDASLFRMNIKNELYYNPNGGPFGFGANENYSKTMHNGFELALDAELIKNLWIIADYTYTKTEFNGEQYKGNAIPMVPRHKGDLRIKVSPLKNTYLNIVGNYLGERYFINDQANKFSRLNGYFTLDANISHTYKNLTMLIGINNIFNKEYSGYGVCNSITGAKNYYPNPGRNFILKLDYKF